MAGEALATGTVATAGLLVVVLAAAAARTVVFVADGLTAVAEAGSLAGAVWLEVLSGATTVGEDELEVRRFNQTVMANAASAARTRATSFECFMKRVAHDSPGSPGM